VTKIILDNIENGIIDPKEIPNWCYRLQSEIAALRRKAKDSKSNSKKSDKPAPKDAKKVQSEQKAKATVTGFTKVVASVGVQFSGKTNTDIRSFLQNNPLIKNQLVSKFKDCVNEADGKVVKSIVLETLRGLGLDGDEILASQFYFPRFAFHVQPALPPANAGDSDRDAGPKPPKEDEGAGADPKGDGAAASGSGNNPRQPKGRGGGKPGRGKGNSNAVILANGSHEIGGVRVLPQNPDASQEAAKAIADAVLQGNTTPDQGSGKPDGSEPPDTGGA
jgi:hypothetical protein